jgi:beta-glucosidase
MFLDPLLLGKYPSDVLEDTGMADWFAQYDTDLAVISAPMDFLGVNYYCPQTIAAPDGPIADSGKASTTPGSENLVSVDTGLDRTQMGWPIDPDSLKTLLRTINELAPGLDLYVTENGAAYPDEVGPDGRIVDPERQRYLEQHIEACRQAVADGLPLKGYFIWTLMDNFEWAYGFSRRFGLVHVDYATQTRTVKESGRWLRKFLSR